MKIKAIYSLTVASGDEIKRIFKASRNRLLNINNWHKLHPSAGFRLTDKDGVKVDRFVKAGDVLKMDGAHISFTIKHLEDLPDSHSETETVSVKGARVADRMPPDPGSYQENVFTIERVRNTITVSVREYQTLGCHSQLNESVLSDRDWQAFAQNLVR